jgi:hypothetical protein
VLVVKLIKLVDPGLIWVVDPRDLFKLGRGERHD